MLRCKVFSLCMLKYTHTHIYIYIYKSQIYKRWPSFDSKICTDSCLQKAKFEENCEIQGTNIVYRQINKDNLCQMEAIVFIILQIFFNMWEKNFYQQLNVYCIRFSLFNVLWYNFANK